MTGFEPILAKVAAAAVSPVFKATLEATIARLKRASDEHANDAEKAIALLETANGFMGALEAETDQILLTAMALPNSPDPQIRSALLTRLNGLLYGEVMRPALALVHARLQVLREELEKDSKRFFGRRPPADGVTTTLDGLGQMIDYIQRYRTWLDPQVSGNYASAPFGPELIELQDMLAAGVDDAVIAERARQTITARPPIGVLRNEQMGAVIEKIRTRIA